MYELFKGLTTPAKTTDEAKKKIKWLYGCCVVTSMSKLDIMSHGQRLDGCHIYPAGAYPQLKKLPINIIPLVSSLHTGDSGTFDWITYSKKERPVEDKINWIMRKVHFDWRQQVRTQLELLEDFVNVLV